MRNSSRLRIGFIQLVSLSCLLFPNYAKAQGSPESKYFDSNGVQIHYVEKGKGQPVVLLHGNTRNIDQWLDSGVFDSLAVDHHVIAYDSRGHGLSGKPQGVDAYGLELGLDILRLLDHLKLEKAHILGYSMGGRVAGGTMPRHQDRFQTLILGGFSPARNWSAEDQASIEARVENTSPERKQLMLDRGLDPLAISSLVLSFSELAVDDSDLVAAAVPTLAIVGTEDPNLTRVRQLEGVIPDFKLVEIDGATHSGSTGAFLSPNFLKEVRQFIANHPVEDL